jgi:transposase-like protein
MKAFEKKLTDEMKEEIVHKYIESRSDPYAVPITQAQLAEEYGLGQSTISRIISDSGVIERVRRRTKSSVLLAQAIAEEAAAHAMRATVESAFKQRDEKYEYINQGDRRDILDRAGVRAEKSDKQDVTISFKTGDFDVGMPGDE